MEDRRYQFEPLSRRHNREAFSCGEPDLDDYLKKHARANQDLDVVTVFVLVDMETESIVGFCGLSASQIERADWPEDVVRRLPRYDVPIALLGRLAVDQRYQGQGFGERILIFALRMAVAGSAHYAAFAVVVDAKHDAAKAFYERYAFRSLPGDPYRLFLPMARVRQLVEKYPE